MNAAPDATIAAFTVDDVCAVVRDALQHETPLRIRGAGTWAGAGAPSTATRTLSLQSLSGIVEYVPGDLTITARAGTSIAELSNATAAHGQWLALDPAGDRLGTIGATIATASSGPLSHGFGTPRDLVLGLEAVTGYGEVVRPGGRVVKNVAGFDLVRLYTGSWGTLGAITAVTLRLRALPPHDVTRSIVLSGDDALRRVLPLLRQAHLSLMACEWIDGATARALGLSNGDPAILLRVGGNDAFVRGQLVALAEIAPLSDCDASVWGALMRRDADASAVVRFTGPVSALPERIAALQQAARAAGVQTTMHATVGRGSIRVITHGDATPIRAVLQPSLPEARVAERLPREWWRTEVDPFMRGLGRKVRAAFDPHLLCNPTAPSDV